MNEISALTEENRTYWTWRAAGYSEVVEQELLTDQKEKWKALLREEMERCFPQREKACLRVLDIGTGPGFFAVLLSELGCAVTGIDFTEKMLEKAKWNAGELADRICFEEMNAECLRFEDSSFDAVVSRNLTWNLPHPETAYREWTRVLKPGGLILNFDANWYRYLFDEDAKSAYERDRKVSREMHCGDQNIGENFDIMEEIAGRIPLSYIMRPQWDLSLLQNMGMQVSADTEIWKRVWSEQEKINFASTPLFLIRAVKPE